MKRLKRFRWVIIVIPYILAFIEYYRIFQEEIPGFALSSALFEAFRIYGMSLSVGREDITLVLDIARWLGALVTASVIIKVIKRIWSFIKLSWRIYNPNTVVVHGDGASKENILQALGKNGVASDDDIVYQARHHVLAFENDHAAIRHIVEHEKEFFSGGKQVCFSSNGYEPADYIQAGLTVSNTAVNCARIYWNKHWLQDEKITRVGIVGFGAFGQRLLEQALLVNVLPWRGPIEYHIYGSDGSDFLAWRPHLPECISVGQSHASMDSLHFHPEVTMERLEHIRRMDRIIISYDTVDENFVCLNQLINAGVNGAIHIRCSAKLLGHLQYLPRREIEENKLQIVPYGDDDELFSPDVILHGKLYATARSNHRAYVAASSPAVIRSKYQSCTAYRACKNGGLCGDCPHANDTWDDLVPFEKASNIASADHEVVKRSLLEMAKRRGGIEQNREELCRIEHIRWSRFYLMHNWQYGPGDKDVPNRLHPDLVPFEQLTPEEQDKDWWVYNDLLNKHVEAGDSHE